MRENVLIAHMNMSQGGKAKMPYFSVLPGYILTMHQIFSAISRLLSTCVTVY